MARWPIKKKKKSGSPRTDAAPHTERPVPAPEADESALETYLPERGEVFFEEEPKPFAVSLREILQEYRSDSSPSRYAMAVEPGGYNFMDYVRPGVPLSIITIAITVVYMYLAYPVYM